MPATTTRKQTAKRAPAKQTTAKRRFDSNWNDLPSKGQLWYLAIAAYEGAVFTMPNSRDATNKLITELKEKGFGNR